MVVALSHAASFSTGSKTFTLYRNASLSLENLRIRPRVAQRYIGLRFALEFNLVVGNNSYALLSGGIGDDSNYLSLTLGSNTILLKKGDGILRCPKSLLIDDHATVHLEGSYDMYMHGIGKNAVLTLAENGSIFVDHNSYPAYIDLGANSRISVGNGGNVEGMLEINVEQGGAIHVLGNISAEGKLHVEQGFIVLHRGAKITNYDDKGPFYMYRSTVLIGIKVLKGAIVMLEGSVIKGTRINVAFGTLTLAKNASISGEGRLIVRTNFTLDGAIYVGKGEKKIIYPDANNNIQVKKTLSFCNPLNFVLQFILQLFRSPFYFTSTIFIEYC